MRISITIALMLLASSIASAQRVTGEADVTAPATSKPGEAILFKVAANPGEEVQWLFLHPRGAGVKTINTTYGLEYIVDPPANYRGPVEVMVQVINWDARTKHVREVVVTVEGARPPPGPDPPDDGGDDPPDDPTVGNELGLGQHAFETAPDAATAQKIAEVYRKAAGFLFATDGTGKSIGGDTEARAKDPKYNVLLWIWFEIAKLDQNNKWREWYEGLNAKYKTSQDANQYTKPVWHASFLEIAEALEAVK